LFCKDDAEVLLCLLPGSPPRGGQVERNGTHYPQKASFFNGLNVRFIDFGDVRVPFRHIPTLWITLLIKPETSVEK